MTPQDMQAAAAAVMSRLQSQGGGGQGGGQISRPFPAGGATSRIDPVALPPGYRPDEGPTGGAFGSHRPDEGPTGTSPIDFGAIMRRIAGNMPPPIGNTGNLPGGDTTARGVPGDHIGLSELAQGSLLDQNTPRNMAGVQGPSSGPLLDIVRMLTQGTNRGRVEEDSPLWNPQTMGNRIGRR